MILLTVPLDEALAREAARGSDEPEVWTLPAGTLTSAGVDLQLGRVTLQGAGSRIEASGPIRLRGQAITIEALTVAGSLAIAGGTATALNLSVEGPLQMSGAEVRLDRVVVTAGAAEVGLDVNGDVVSINATQVVGAPAAGDQTGARLTAARELVVQDLAVTTIQGAVATGVALFAPAIRMSGVAVEGVVGTTDAAGVRALAGTLVATHLAVEAVSGPEAVGVVLAADTLEVFDLSVAALAATARGIGARLVGSLILRGFTIAGVHAPAAEGLLAVAAALDVSVGEIRDVLAADAAGARLFCTTPVATVSVHDLVVDGVGRFAAGTPDPGGDAPLVVPADWDSWARRVAADQRGASASLAAIAEEAHGTAWQATPRPLGTVPPLPARPGSTIVGVHLGALVSPAPGAQPAPGLLTFAESFARRVAGAAIQVEAGLRSAVLDQLELAVGAAAGWISGDEVGLSHLTVHAQSAGLMLAPGLYRVTDSLFSRIGAGPALVRDPDATLDLVSNVFTTSSDPAEDPRLGPLSPLPYLDPGPPLPVGITAGEVPEETDMDLRPVAGAAFVGAHQPEDPTGGTCGVRDPEPHAEAAARPPAPAANPVVDYTARDGVGLLGTMLERARVTMPDWTTRGPADFVTMVFELLADRLDAASYGQERVLAESFLDSALLRRSVEDHARALDYQPDPGLSATAMLSFQLVGDPTALAPEGFVVIPAGTLVAPEANPDATAIFATESDLALYPGLDRVALFHSAAVGDTSATLAPAPGLAVGRWLLFCDGPHDAGHVVRLTSVDVRPDSVLVGWDPRRPLPRAYQAPTPATPATPVWGNVVPAHHGVPLDTASDDPLLERWRALLRFTVSGQNEVAVPLGPVSVQAGGWPRPDEVRRAGEPRLRLAIDGVEWQRVDDLATAAPHDPVFVLRAGEDGPVVRFGNGENGAALPDRPAEITLAMSVGLGRVANVGPGRLVALVQVGGELERNVAALPPDPVVPVLADRVRQVLKVTNPLAAMGGRDPEPLERIRYRAPFTVRDALSAVSTDDYQRLLAAMPEVAAVRARALTDGIRPLVRNTVLLADLDTLDPDERLRRFALVRRRLEEIRLLGVDVEAVPPSWVPLDLDLVVDADAHADAAAVQDAVFAGLAGDGGLFDPDRSGLGGDVYLSSVYQTVLGVEGVQSARVKRFRRLQEDAPEELGSGVIAIGPDEVAVVKNPLPGGDDGVLTITVCGGLR